MGATDTMEIFFEKLNSGDRQGAVDLMDERVEMRVHVREGSRTLRGLQQVGGWFLRGDTNIKYLNDHGVSIWNEWADEDGNLGPVYGVQWRSWPAPDGSSIDQISQVVQQLKEDPDSRRIIVSVDEHGLLLQRFVRRGRYIVGTGGFSRHQVHLGSGCKPHDGIARESELPRLRDILAVHGPRRHRRPKTLAVEVLSSGFTVR